VSKQDDYESASVEQVKIGVNRIEMSLAHKFEGFYLQCEPMKIYEDAFLAKCKRSRDRGRFADETLVDIRSSYASVGIHVDEHTHKVTMEKFFTKEKDPTKRGTFHVVSNSHGGGVDVTEHHGDAGNHRQDLIPGDPGSHKPCTYNVYYKGDVAEKGTVLHCVLGKDSNQNHTSEGYDWEVELISGEAVGEQGITEVVVREISDDEEHGVVWEIRMKQKAGFHKPLLAASSGMGGCCVVS
jgi:hypothetical protein